MEGNDDVLSSEQTATAPNLTFAQNMPSLSSCTPGQATTASKPCSTPSLGPGSHITTGSPNGAHAQLEERAINAYQIENENLKIKETLTVLAFIAVLFICAALISRASQKKRRRVDD